MYVSSDMQFPGPHASPPLDPLSRFGSAHAACSLYFTMGRETPKIAHSPGGIRVPLHTCYALSPSDSILQTAWIAGLRS